MKYYKDILIKDNSIEIYCILQYVILDKTPQGYRQCLCSPLYCNSFETAIDYYYKHYYKPNSIPIYITLNGYTIKECNSLSTAC